jgi:hypothetical protein
MTTGDAWPSITEFVQYALVSEHDTLAWRGFYERLGRAREADPERAAGFFLALLNNPLKQVRELAVTVGAKLGGPDVVNSLPGLLDDPAWEVQELAMQTLAKASPDALRDRAVVLRRKFSEWRGLEDGDPQVHLAWTAVKLDIVELAPEISRMAGDETLYPARRRQAAVRPGGLRPLRLSGAAATSYCRSPADRGVCLSGSGHSQPAFLAMRMASILLRPPTLLIAFDR